MTKGMKTQSMTRTCIKPVNDNVNWGSSLWLSFMFSPCEGSEGTWRNPVIPHQFKRSCFDVGPSHALLLPMTSWTKKNAACWSVMHGSNCLSVMLVLVRHDVQQHLIFLETLSMLTTQKKRQHELRSHKVVSSNSVKGQPTMSATNRSTISESA